MKVTNISTIPRAFRPYIAITGHKAKIIGDPNGMVIHCLQSKPLPRVSRNYRCLVTDKAGLLVNTGDSVLYLNPDLVRRLFLTSLPHKAYRTLIKVAPDDFWLHDDFYNESGLALQPKRARVS